MPLPPHRADAKKIRVQNVGSFNPRPSSARPRIAVSWSNVMDILYRASWRQSCRNAKTCRPCVAAAEPSGIRRLVLAIVIIAAIVAMLDRAADANAGARVASATVQKHQGAPK